MNVVKDWEALVRDLKRRINNGDESCRPLFQKAERDLIQAKGKETNRCGHGR